MQKVSNAKRRDSLGVMDLGQRLVEVSRRNGLLMVVGAGAIWFLPESFLTDNMPDRPFVPTAIVYGIAVSIALMRAVFIPKSRQALIIQDILLQIAIILGISYLTPLGGTYTIFAMFAALILYFDYGRIGVYISLVVQGLGMLLMGYILGEWDSTAEVMHAVAGFTFISVMTLFVTQFLKILTDVQHLTELELQQIELEQRRLSTLINNQREAVIACDVDFNIILCNSATNTLLNTHGELAGKNLLDLMNLKDSEGNSHSLQEELKHQSGTATFNNYAHYFTEDDFINLNIFIAGIEHSGHAGKNRNYMVVMRDITKEKSLEEERDEFVSIMSHELRTPVSIASGSVSLSSTFLEQKKYDQAAERLAKAKDSLAMLAEIVNSLSTLVHNERLGDNLETKAVSPEEVATSMYQNYLSEAEAKGLELRISIAKDLPTITTNQEYVYEILQNFMTNALKYTADGYIEISADKAGADHIRLAITDSGAGMSTADQKHLFQKFWRSENYKTRKSGGTGIGLYITKKLADSLQAEVEVISELNKGSTFALILPPAYKPKKHISPNPVRTVQTAE